MNQHMPTVSGIPHGFTLNNVYTVHKYVIISWTSDRLSEESLALSILEIGSEPRNDTNSLIVLAVLIKSSDVDVSWRVPRFSSRRWKLNLLMLYLCHKRLILLATEEPLPSIAWRRWHT